MNLHFTICPLATVVLICVILVTILEIYVVGTSVIVLILSVLLSVLSVWIANKTCFSYRWISWLIVTYLVISIIGYIIIIVKPELVEADPKMKKMMEENKVVLEEIQKVEKELF
jgi:hypothetical protein